MLADRYLIFLFLTIYYFEKKSDYEMKIKPLLVHILTSTISQTFSNLLHAVLACISVGYLTVFFLCFANKFLPFHSSFLYFPNFSPLFISFHFIHKFFAIVCWSLILFHFTDAPFDHKYYLNDTPKFKVSTNHSCAEM